MRIQKFLAACGVGSRRAVERLISEGRVQVNGEIAHIGHDIDPDRDELRFDGRLVKPPDAIQLVMMNKPAGYVSTVSDPQGRPTVMELLPPGLGRLFPVGRLDRDSQGLLLFTNDGELTHKLLHPSRGVWKRYRAEVEYALGDNTLRELCNGVSLEDGVTAPCRARMEARTMHGPQHVILEIKEGKKRQVRRMLGVLGHPVLNLERIAFGPLQLADLPVGQTRSLRPAEEKSLRAAADGKDGARKDRR